MNKIYIALGALALTACSNESKWTLNADLGKDAAGSKGVVESVSNGRWLFVDSVTIDDNGHVKGKWDREAWPNILRLRVDGIQPIYFPVDSDEMVTIDLQRRLYGSASARMMTQVDSILEANAATWAADPAVKRAISQLIVDNSATVGAYYTVSRTIDGRPLYNGADKSDLRVIGAVANAYINQRPDDPRTAWLTQQYVGNRRTTLRPDTLYAMQIGAFDIEGRNPKGKLCRLDEVKSGARATVLNFSDFESSGWPAVNRAISQAVKPYGDGVHVFEVAIGEDEAQWRQTSEALPWTCIYLSPYSASKTLATYNVTALPTTFILNSAGEVAERVDDLTELPKVLGKYF